MLIRVVTRRFRTSVNWGLEKRLVKPLEVRKRGEEISKMHLAKNIELELSPIPS